MRYRRHDESTFLYAFDLIELNGDDFRRDSLEGRKPDLRLSCPRVSARVQTQPSGDCLEATHRTVRADLTDWRKMKNAHAPAVKREAEEDWGKTMAMIEAGGEVLMLKRASGLSPVRPLE